jgi:hypothetical protein
VADDVVEGLAPGVDSPPVTESPSGAGAPEASGTAADAAADGDEDGEATSDAEGLGVACSTLGEHAARTNPAMRSGTSNRPGRNAGTVITVPQYAPK